MLGDRHLLVGGGQESRNLYSVMFRKWHSYVEVLESTYVIVMDSDKDPEMQGAISLGKIVMHLRY